MSPYKNYIVRPAEIEDGGKASFSEKFAFRRVGAHHVVLTPGAQSSLPHAESREEEFVFIVSGNPHAWIDGFVYQLRPGVAVGFPAGTGIAHCFINNTESEVELLVFGERTKNDNLCFFPVNPEQKQTCGIWWADAPARTLGPHSGRPGPVRPEELGGGWPSFIVDCKTLSLSSGWHYPGDSEIFGDGVRLTDELGLKALGIGFETLRPGRRSAFPHSHKMEEEFAYILSGTATIWMNGFVAEARAGTAVVFAPGTNIAHAIINDSDQVVTYLMLGEATDEGNEDKIFYPQHPFRNEQCRYRKDFWYDRPSDLKVGTHDGRPINGLGEHFSLRHVTSADEIVLLNILQGSSGYFRSTEGCFPTMNSARSLMVDGPKKKSETYRKEILFLDYKDKPVGIVDVHIDHPEAGTTYVGLLLLKEEEIGKGLGRKFYELVEHYVKTIFATKKIRLGVSDDNDVSAFWKKLGFVANGRNYSWQGENKVTNVIEYDKILTTK